MLRLYCWPFVVLLAYAIPAHSKGKPEIDLALYPEASSERSLPEIIKELRRFLKDSASITDFALCTPVAKFKVQDGRLKFWTYLFSLNSKNGFGAYTGVEHYSAVFRPGKPVQISSLTVQGEGGFASLANMMIEKDMRKCDFLPKEEVQQLLNAR